MALSQETINESDLAKSYVTNSNLDENYKKTLLSLINITTLATNGISQEEKIQKMTEAIHLLAISQINFITRVDQRIQSSIENANLRQCHDCKAMKFVQEEEDKRKQQEFMDQWKREHAVIETKTTNKEEKKDLTISDTIKSILLKPYFWIFSSILVFSPYGLEIVKQIMQYCSK